MLSAWTYPQRVSNQDLGYTPEDRYSINYIKIFFNTTAIVVMTTAVNVMSPGLYRESEKHPDEPESNLSTLHRPDH